MSDQNEAVKLVNYFIEYSFSLITRILKQKYQEVYIHLQQDHSCKFQWQIIPLLPSG